MWFQLDFGLFCCICRRYFFALISGKNTDETQSSHSGKIPKKQLTDYNKDKNVSKKNMRSSKFQNFLFLSRLSFIKQQSIIFYLVTKIFQRTRAATKNVERFAHLQFSQLTPLVVSFV